MAGVLGSIAMVTGITVLTMSKTFQSVVEAGSSVVTAVADTVSDTVVSAHKLTVLGNQSVHRAADRADVNSRLKDKEAKLRMSTRKQSALVEYGENVEKLKERYDKLDEKTQEVLQSLEVDFPEELL